MVGQEPAQESPDNTDDDVRKNSSPPALDQNTGDPSREPADD